jgi:hypothetical protein
MIVLAVNHVFGRDLRMVFLALHAYSRPKSSTPETSKEAGLPHQWGTSGELSSCWTIEDGE